MGHALTEADEIYEQLWRNTGPLLKSGDMRIDPYLRNRVADNRRGVTLVARPDPGVLENVEALLRRIAGLYPRQHFYKPAELHMTVMAIIPGTEFWESEKEHLPACCSIVDEVLKDARTFTVDFRGVTVSPDAVMIQGFPADNNLLELRNRLRKAFKKAGLVQNLDRRYKTVTAHLTGMRFSQPEADWERLFDLLREHREKNFGRTHFQSLELIWSNWYASADLVCTLRDYPLQG